MLPHLRTVFNSTHNKDKWIDRSALRRDSREVVIKEKRRKSRFSFCCTVLRIILGAAVCPRDTPGPAEHQNYCSSGMHMQKCFLPNCLVSELLSRCCLSWAGKRTALLSSHRAKAGAKEAGACQPQQPACPADVLLHAIAVAKYAAESNTRHRRLLLLTITRVVNLELPSLWHGRDTPQSS